MILNGAIVLFILLELLNVIILYTQPEFKHGNSMRIFLDYSESKNDVTKNLFNHYMVNWVANSKLIFISLLAVIVIFGTEQVKIISIVVTVFSIGAYFITLHPIMKKLDQLGMIRPMGYSRILGYMIAGFMVMFMSALTLHMVL